MRVRRRYQGLLGTTAIFNLSPSSRAPVKIPLKVLTAVTAGSQEDSQQCHLLVFMPCGVPFHTVSGLVCVMTGDI